MLLWIRSGERKTENYGQKVAIFRGLVIEMITMKAPLYSINIGYVDPKEMTNSRGHYELMRRYGLNRHIAYLIALKVLKLF